MTALAASTLAFSPPRLSDVCDGLPGVILEDGFELCSHGDDDHFAAADPDEPTRTSGKVPGRRAQCYGNGSDGPRVQVLYVYADTSPNRVRTYRKPIRRWSEQVEWTFVASAEAKGGDRRVRWLTKRPHDGRCAIRVRAVGIPAYDLIDFGRMVARLRSAGLSRPDRKYLIFADSERYCGLASAPRDDRDGQNNVADTRSGYARIDRPCWDSGDRGTGSVAAHELMHTIGAVQNSAPHATGSAHCTDEFDLMCYRDSDDAHVSVRCRDSRSDTSGAGDHRNWLFDCGGDDYFRPQPASGSYLDRHWNTADSSFLARSPGSAGAGGGSGGVPLRGDWNGDGRSDLGRFRDGVVTLRLRAGAEHSYRYGRAGDIPIVGDWNGDGVDTLGIIRDGEWHLRNHHSGGGSDVAFSYGRVTRGDVPIVGDWDGRRGDEIGIIRDGEWHLRYSLSGGHADKRFVYGRIRQGDRPLVGDWNGDGKDTIGIVRSGEWHLRRSLSGGRADLRFVYGRVRAGDLPLVGDWTDDGIDTPGIVRGVEWHLRHRNAGGPADKVVKFPG